MLMKLLIFDLRETEAVDGFVRRLERARKHGQPDPRIGRGPRGEQRDRRFLIMRYNVQHMVSGSLAPFAPEIRQRLSAETLEPIEVAPYNHVTELVKARKSAGWRFEAQD